MNKCQHGPDPNCVWENNLDHIADMRKKVARLQEENKRLKDSNLESRLLLVEAREIITVLAGRYKDESEICLAFEKAEAWLHKITNE